MFVCRDCSGICGGTATITSCGVCTGGETGLPEDYPTDCRGICYGEYSRDSCGVCQQNSNPIDYRDCTGKCFGSAKVCMHLSYISVNLVFLFIFITIHNYS